MLSIQHPALPRRYAQGRRVPPLVLRTPSELSARFLGAVSARR